ncbi:MAG: YeeE/YedE family protein [Bdellovibrionota bacterium]|nr:YeeE/YedE family protein [Bdellovibrionota bacterium]
MNIINFTPVPALIGGLILGLASVLLLISNGKIAGISGIAKGMFNSSDKAWRIFFIVGLILGGFGYHTFISEELKTESILNIDLKLIIAAILVGSGTALGNGCTSGHGICGLSRRTKRSFVATCVFMAFGMLTVYLEKLF